MNKQKILKLLPEIKLISKPALREMTIRAWLNAVDKGSWRRIDDLPFTLLIKTRKTLIEHTRIVARMAYSIARERHGVNTDIVLTGALVHDIGKLLEYCRKGKKIVKSDQGKLIRHPVSGYALCLEVGLPMSVAHIVAAHSTEGDKVRRSPEAVIINHCDFIDFDIEKNRG